jgi:hypothetical protein
VTTGFRPAGHCRQVFLCAGPPHAPHVAHGLSLEPNAVAVFGVCLRRDHGHVEMLQENGRGRLYAQLLSVLLSIDVVAIGISCKAGTLNVADENGILDAFLTRAGAEVPGALQASRRHQHHRLLKMEHAKVYFHWKGYAHGSV